MTLTTPAQENYTRFSCPTPPCARGKRPGEGNLAHRSWTGTHQPIERLRCTTCCREGSDRDGSLMAGSKLPEATGIRLVRGTTLDITLSVYGHGRSSAPWRSAKGISSPSTSLLTTETALTTHP